MKTEFDRAYVTAHGKVAVLTLNHPEAMNAAGVKLAEQIRGHVQGKKLVKKSTGDVLGSITVSIGVAELVGDEVAASLIHRADACLYRAKHAGRNCVIGDNDPRFAELDIDAA